MAFHTHYDIDAVLTDIARRAGVDRAALLGRAEVQDLRDAVHAGQLLQELVQREQLELRLAGANEDVLSSMEKNLAALDTVDTLIANLSQLLVEALHPRPI